MTKSSEVSITDIEKLIPPAPSIFYRFVSWCLVYPIFRLFFRGKVFGLHNVPLNGPIVIVANHGSHLDPPLLGHALRRPVSFMAKAELFKVPLLGSIIRACGAYPVSRGTSDRKAIRTASSRLLEGWAIGVFLDGTRQRNGKVNKPKAGAALLSARSRAPLLPVAIVNSNRAFGVGSIFPRFVPISIHVGELVSPPLTRKKSDLDQTTLIIQGQINDLLDKGFKDS